MSVRQWVAPQELTIFEACQLWQDHADILPRSCEFHVDISRTTEMDSAGAQLLLFIVTCARQNDCQVQLTGISEAIGLKLKQLGLLKPLGLEEPA